MNMKAGIRMAGGEGCHMGKWGGGCKGVKNSQNQVLMGGGCKKKSEIKNINFTAMKTSNVMIQAKNFDLFGV